MLDFISLQNLYIQSSKLKEDIVKGGMKARDRAVGQSEVPNQILFQFVWIQISPSETLK